MGEDLSRLKRLPEEVPTALSAPLCHEVQASVSPTAGSDLQSFLKLYNNCRLKGRARGLSQVPSLVPPAGQVPPGFTERAVGTGSLAHTSQSTRRLLGARCIASLRPSPGPQGSVGHLPSTPSLKTEHCVLAGETPGSKPCLPPAHPKTSGFRCPVCKRGWMGRGGEWESAERLHHSAMVSTRVQSQLTTYQPGRPAKSGSHPRLRLPLCKRDRVK